MQPEKITVSKDDRALIEAFMEYADGYLSQFITWNDIMPVLEKIAKSDRATYCIEVIPSGYVRISGRFGMAKNFYNASVEGSLLKAAQLAAVQFIKKEL